MRSSAERRAAGGKPIRKVAVTGGGCAGKTTFMGLAAEAARARGWAVITVPEIPTLVMSNGVGPGTRAPFMEYERAILDIQVAWEEASERVADAMEGDAPVLILCDRGIPEIAAYMGDGQYARVLAEAGMARDDALATYDAAIHLVSVADGAPGLYGTENNGQRYETVDEALRQELRIRECWEGHARRVVIGVDAESLDGKMAKALRALADVMDEAEGATAGR